MFLLLFFALLHETLGVPRLSWRIQPNTSPDSVARFQVEWKSQTEQRWNTHKNTVI